ncbi:alpha/beta fold hydrolase [Microbulbifer mangrovi]|uniref:alpha/beta fold hydrolase n=1 Tax=Microbulbifer mangrovi TaxID=927787 RepID=UPI000990449B|nr:alpha/beta hydrolase [Microbulbifer mangrovi]
MVNRHLRHWGHASLCAFFLTASPIHTAGAESPDTYQVEPRDALLSDYPYPYPVKVHTLPAQALDTRNQTQVQGGLRMAYMDVSPSDRKAADAPRGTVLLLHGKNFSGAYWKTTIEALSAQGYRVIVPDQVGFGKSSKPQDFHFSFQALANQTHSLLDALEIEKVHIAGHSMGGMLATRFALMYPQLVEKLVLVNPIGLEDWKRHVPYQTIEQATQAELKQTPAGVKAYMTRAYFDGKWKPRYNALLDIQAGWTLGPDAATIASIDARTSDMVFTQPVVYEFEDLRAPTLLIIGTRDRTAIGRNRATQAAKEKLGRYDQLGKATAEKIPNATLVELDNIGHVPQYEAFDRYMGRFSEFLEKDQGFSGKTPPTRQSAAAGQSS